LSINIKLANVHALCHFIFSSPHITRYRNAIFTFDSVLRESKKSNSQSLHVANQIDGDDLVRLLNDWNLVGPGDISRDGFVNARDLADLLGGWGPCN
jgi:hypothetical protein